MPQGSYHFPAGFLWGTATAAHQVEGQNKNNNWSAWEEQPGRILNGQRSGLACDWWGGRWKEDFDRAVETGQNAHRLSIEWSRVQPAPDRWDENALNYYREILRGLYERKITPMITLHHFTDPLWFSELGGWENDAAPQYFAAFVRKAVEALKEYCSLWVTINEPNVYTSGGYLNGGFPPGKNDINLAGQVMLNMVRGHAAAYKIIHEVQPQARVGTSIHYRVFWPARPWFLPDRAAASLVDSSFNNSFIRALVDGKFRFLFKNVSVPEAAHTQNFVGVNYYSGDLVKFVLDPAKAFNLRYYPESAELSSTGFIANLPGGFYDCLKWAAKFSLPILVTENGVEDPDDRLRPRYLVEHLHQMWRGINYNWPIKGYFHWSLVDNFEWERGWSQRFGLWGLDVDTQARIRRPSVDLYAAVCKSNSISSEVVQQYAPRSFQKIFPG